MAKSSYVNQKEREVYASLLIVKSINKAVENGEQLTEDLQFNIRKAVNTIKAAATEEPKLFSQFSNTVKTEALHILYTEGNGYQHVFTYPFDSSMYTGVNQNVLGIEGNYPNILYDGVTTLIKNQQNTKTTFGLLDDVRNLSKPSLFITKDRVPIINTGGGRIAAGEGARHMGQERVGNLHSFSEFYQDGNAVSPNIQDIAGGGKSYIINFTYSLGNFPQKVMVSSTDQAGAKNNIIAKSRKNRDSELLTFNFNGSKITFGAAAPYSNESRSKYRWKDNDKKLLGEFNLSGPKKSFKGNHEPYSLCVVFTDASGLTQTVYTDYKFSLGKIYKVKLKLDSTDNFHYSKSLDVELSVDDTIEYIAYMKGSLISKAMRPYKKSAGWVGNSYVRPFIPGMYKNMLDNKFKHYRDSIDAQINNPESYFNVSNACISTQPGFYDAGTYVLSVAGSEKLQKQEERVNVNDITPGLVYVDGTQSNEISLIYQRAESAKNIRLTFLDNFELVKLNNIIASPMMAFPSTLDLSNNGDVFRKIYNNKSTKINSSLVINSIDTYYK